MRACWYRVSNPARFGGRGVVPGAAPATRGGLDGVRAVVLDDSLGIAADLDAAMARHVDAYEDEWAATLADPEKLRRFASFVNAPTTPDPSLAYVAERGQARPATAAERADSAVLVAGTTLAVRS